MTATEIKPSRQDGDVRRGRRGLTRPTVLVRAALTAIVCTAGASGTAMAAEQAPVNITVTAPAAVAGGELRPMSEGGRDGDHWWVKISTAELATIGATAACQSKIPPPVSGFVCPPLAAAINRAVEQFPGAGGFWGEFYDSGQVRVGKW